jgi:hypothetical protein
MTGVRFGDWGELCNVPGADLVGITWLEGRFQLDDFPDHSVHLRAELVDGRYIATELAVRPAGHQRAAVTGELLRSIPVQWLLAELMRGPLRQAQGYRRQLDRGAIHPGNLHWGGQSGDRLDSQYSRWLDTELGPGSEEFLAEVARCYRIARLLGDPPSKSVEETFGVSRATASRYVAQARAAGLLGQEETGHAGGAPPRPAVRGKG